MMGVMTVFLTVSFITFLGGIGSLGPITTLKTAIYHAGDFDVMFKCFDKPRKLGNTNYYTDDNEFFDAPYMSRSDKMRLMAEQSFKSRIPTVNFTELEQTALDAYGKYGKETPIELFPRWVAQTTLYNPQMKSKSTTAHMIAGDSYLERKINVAPEFPKMLLARHELTTSTDVMQLLSLEEGQQVEAHVSLHFTPFLTMLTIRL